MVSGTPARDAAQAGRWARGLLLHENTRHEKLSFETEFNPGYTAMTRIDVEDESDAADAAGEWLIEEARHDFLERRSWVSMRRCVESVR